MGEEKVENRRAHVRVLVRVLVDFESPNTYLYDYSNDLSEGGIFVETEKPMPVDTPLTLRFTLPDVDQVFEAKAAVRWVNAGEKDPNPAKRGLARGMGVQFVDMEEKDRDLIRKYIQNISKK